MMKNFVYSFGVAVECRTFSRLAASLVLAYVIPSTSFAGTPFTYFRASEIACDSNLEKNSNECYAQVREKFVQRLVKRGFSETESRNFKSIEDSKDGYSTYIVQKERPKNVLITIHGLWGNAEQFEPVVSRLQGLSSTTRDQNVIELTLPGHLKRGSAWTEDYQREIKRNPPFATYQEWLAALDETMSAASYLGDNVTIVVQSTGGLLAVLAAHRYPTLVKSVVLIEPALRVRPILNFGSCTLGSALDHSSILRAIGRIVHGAFPPGTSVKMGCEVQKLMNAELAPFTSANEKGKQAYFSKLKQLAAEIRQPVILFNNANDKVVDKYANSTFYEALPGRKQYREFNRDNSVVHGMITATDGNLLTLAMVDNMLITDDSLENRKVYAFVLWDFSNSMTGLSDIHPATELSPSCVSSACLKVRLNTLETSDWPRRLCAFVDVDECSKTKQAFDQLNTFYQQLITMADDKTQNPKIFDFVQKPNVQERMKRIENALSPVIEKLYSLSFAKESNSAN